MARIEITILRQGKGVRVKTHMVRDSGDSELVKDTAKKIHMALGGFVLSMVSRIFAKVDDASKAEADKNSLH